VVAVSPAVAEDIRTAVVEDIPVAAGVRPP